LRRLLRSARLTLPRTTRAARCTRRPDGSPLTRAVQQPQTPTAQKGRDVDKPTRSAGDANDESDALTVSSDPFTWRPLPDALIFDRDVPDGAVRLWGALRAVADAAPVTQSATCEPVTMHALAAMLGVNERSVQRWMRALDDAGWLDRIERRADSGRTLPSAYHVRVRRRDRPTSVSGEGDRFVTPEGDTVVTPSTESEREHLTTFGVQPSDKSVAKAKSARAKKAANPRAQQLLDRWWEQQQPRPVQPYPSCLQAVTKCVEAGWTDDEIVAALNDAPNVTTGTLQYARNKRNGKGSTSKNPLTDQIGAEYARRQMERMTREHANGNDGNNRRDTRALERSVSQPQERR